MHIAWINETADAAGGCERYIRETADLLFTRHGVRASLLYRHVETPADPQTVATFHRTGGVFPLVEPERQFAALQPDLIFVHRLAEESLAPAVADAARTRGIPSLRFIHDHRLFCPREHKYTVVDKTTCTRTVGAGCFACGGVINRTPRGFRLQLPGALLARQRATRDAFDATVVGSQYMRDHLIAHGFAPDAVFALPLYALPTPLPPPDASFRNPHELVFAGQMVTGKGIDTLLMALCQTRTPARLTLYGAGKQEAEYRTLARTLGLDQRVVWGGKVGPETLDAAFRSCAAVVFPSRTPETFGLIGPEAMRHGTPVIATGVGGMTEWLRDGEMGLATPVNDAPALARAIDRLLGDPALAQRLGDGARAAYLARFTPEAHVDSLLSLLTRLGGASRKDMAA